MPKWPHDDTQSLIAFYGDPRQKGFTSNLVVVKPPWQMTYEGRPVKGVQIHKRCAASLKAVFDEIAREVDGDWSKLPAGAYKFSGSYNFRPVRGSNRLSCHAFGAAIDLDAEDNPMNSRGDLGTMDDIVINAFKRQGWVWGGDFRSRKDPMHFQAAYTNTPTQGVGLLSEVDDDPPMVDAHAEVDEDEVDDYPRRNASIAGLAQSTITQVPKTMLKSKIGWAQILAFFGLGGYGAQQVDASFFAQLYRFVTSPGFMLLLVLACIGLTIYWRWRDYGRGSIR